MQRQVRCSFNIQPVNRNMRVGDFMLWSELWGGEYQPSDDQIKEFVETPLWDDLADHIQQTYKVQPKLAYSRCAMDNGSWKGWNVKYKKGGRSLCTLYPKQGYFISLVSIGFRELNEAELLMPICTGYTQNLFEQAVSGHTGKMLAIDVTNEGILHDVKELIALRLEPKRGCPDDELHP